MNIKDLTDEELTRLIAEKVMGWKIRKDITMWFTEDGNPTGLWVNWDTTGDKFKPLTDKNHLWMVVERMREKKYLISIEQGISTYTARFDPWQEGSEDSVWLVPGTSNDVRHGSLNRAVLEAAAQAIGESIK